MTARVSSLFSPYPLSLSIFTGSARAFSFPLFISIHHPRGRKARHPATTDNSKQQDAVAPKEERRRFWPSRVHKKKSEDCVKITLSNLSKEKRERKVREKEQYMYSRSFHRIDSGATGARRARSRLISIAPHSSSESGSC